MQRKVGDNINIDKMINMLLLRLSEEHEVFFMERRTYKEKKISRSYYVKIDDLKEDFKNKRDLLIYLSKY